MLVDTLSPLYVASARDGRDGIDQRRANRRQLKSRSDDTIGVSASRDTATSLGRWSLQHPTTSSASMATTYSAARLDEVIAHHQSSQVEAIDRKRGVDKRGLRETKS